MIVHSLGNIMDAIQATNCNQPQLHREHTLTVCPRSTIINRLKHPISVFHLSISISRIIPGLISRSGTTLILKVLIRTPADLVAKADKRPFRTLLVYIQRRTICSLKHDRVGRVWARANIEFTGDRIRRYINLRIRITNDHKVILRNVTSSIRMTNLIPVASRGQNGCNLVSFHREEYATRRTCRRSDIKITRSN